MSARGSIDYFAYGSNLHVGRMKERIPEAKIVGPAVLDQHRLRFDKRGRDGTAKANIEPCVGERVWGVVYRLPREQLTTLDGFEGGYARIAVEVALENGSTRECETYFCENGTAGLVAATWYLALIVEGARTHGLPADYVARLERVPTRSDAR